MTHGLRSDALAAVALVALVVATACDPGRALVIVNTTDEPITVDFFSGRGPSPINPGEERRFGVLEGRSVGYFEIYSASGEMLFAGDPTWSELEAIDFRMVVTEEGIRTLR